MYDCKASLLSYIALLKKAFGAKSREGGAFWDYCFVNLGEPATLLRDPHWQKLFMEDKACLHLVMNKQKWQYRSDPVEFWYVTAWHFSQMLLKSEFSDKMQLLLSNARAKEESWASSVSSISPLSPPSNSSFFLSLKGCVLESREFACLPRRPALHGAFQAF